MSDEIDLYYWPTPNGWKITIALEEMDLPYNLHLVNIGTGEQFEPDFLRIAPNNRMPAIVDPNGPDGKPISIFESGAILQYLARKTGKFGGVSERNRIEVDQWLMWQMGGLGPMAGQAHHFLKYAPSMEPPHDLPYAKDRYRNETGRLLRVLDTQIGDKEFVCGDFSIADMAIWPWACLWEGQEQDISELPNLKGWLDRCYARPAVQTGRAVSKDIRDRKQETGEMKAAQKILFGQKG